MPFSPRAIGRGLVLRRVDLDAHGDYDIVERETRTRIVYRVLNLGGEPSFVGCGLIGSEPQFIFVDAAAAHILHVDCPGLVRADPRR